MALPGYKNSEIILQDYPLHCHIWNDEPVQLDEALTSKLHDYEKTDPHKRTPLHLAVTLGRVDCVRVLLQHKCDANATNKEGWSVVQEAVGTGNPELLALIIQNREYQRLTERTGGIPQILEALEEADDFYLEMKWEFSSWVPFVSRMCPSDTYRIWKSGANVRIDSTLVGFDQMSWQRGKQSFIFKGERNSSHLFEVNHEKKTFWKEVIKLRQESVSLDSVKPPVDIISMRMTSPNITTSLDTERLSFTRQRSGFLGWGGDKCEVINGYESKIYNVTGVEVITRTRTEHMTEEDRERFKEEKTQSQSRLPSFFNLFHQDEEDSTSKLYEKALDPDTTNPFRLSIEQYFNPKENPGKDIGRCKRMTSKSQKFSATLALCDNFPLSLQDQVLPVINLMANSNTHFAKLRDFITLQLPAGFPVKIEIPLFHVLNARVTFGNFNGTESLPEGLITLNEDEAGNLSVPDPDEPSEAGAEGQVHKKVRCLIDKLIFDLPHGYKELGVEAYERQGGYRDEDDELLQLAIQQSLLDGDPEQDVTLLEALGYGRNDPQRAIQESLLFPGDESEADRVEAVREPSSDVIDEDLRRALEMSERELFKQRAQEEQEDEELQMILRLSMTEK
ncbi:ankyrin repeat domain-containing protein 13D-like [Rhopilema esculentum]|uniref:ankyrin repeat domain-containing protein 13D-like n=1 Tax=Rhopilema esculentum TaxID=499914 RepID=UPI0031D33D6B|eukprot:gene15126-6312_t